MSEKSTRIVIALIRSFHVKRMRPSLITIDFESILAPEMWVEVAKSTNIPDLGLTTRDIPDYDHLMQDRIKILQEFNLTLSNIVEVLEQSKPLPGAVDFFNALQKIHPVIIVSDTFRELARPLLQKFGNPTIFCHTLETNESGHITNYRIRENGSKREVVMALQRIGYHVFAMGDSFNDISMLKQANQGALLLASEMVKKNHPDLPILHTYEEALAFVSS